jgi:RimJ/RimL family protein N-acetyltransferase
VRLETPRLILRPWEDRDRAPLANILGDPEVRRFYPAVLTPEQTGAQIDASIALAAEHGFHFQAAELSDTGELAGVIGLGMIPADTRAVLNDHPAVEIGWQFDKRFWGQGLAPEGARAWLDAGFGTLGLDEIVAFTYRGNLPSQRVMQKLDMTRDEADDFDHPKLAADHKLRPHVLYRIGREGSRPSRQIG